MRGAVVRYVVAVDAAAAWPLVERAAADAGLIVRANVADGLADLEDVRALPLRQRLANDADDDVRAAAASARESRHG